MAAFRFTWDAAETGTNRRKHGISFENPARVFLDLLQLTVQDGIEGGE